MKPGRGRCVEGDEGLEIALWCNMKFGKYPVASASCHDWRCWLLQVAEYLFD
jgi:hypothetical protein